MGANNGYPQVSRRSRNFRQSNQDATTVDPEAYGGLRSEIDPIVVSIRLTGILGLPFSLLLTCGGLLLLKAAFLREDPLFWRNVGGYSVELRNMVLILFYPGMVLHAVLIGIGFYMSCRWMRSRPWDAMLLMCGSITNLLLLFAVTSIIIWNNLMNYLEGLPLHQH